jgi:lipoprotein-anchoring transpeptidase ErfK/SrfK
MSPTWAEGKGTTVFQRAAKTALANRRITAKRATIAAAVIGAAALATGVGLTLSAGGGAASPGAAGAPRPPQRTMPARRAILSRQPRVPGSAVPGSTVLAAVRGTAPRYASPGRRAAGTVPASWYGRPSVLPVIATRPGWVQVRLAQRPDGSSAWLPASDVKLSSTPYRIVISLARTRLALYDHGRLVFSAPAGVGTPDDPTPAGEYFVAFDEQPPQPNPGYGPFIIVTSAHSQAISDWEGSGDAVIGIHGPLGDDSETGTTGARISHGCVRLHVPALERLDAVPPGTPIDVVG